MSLNIQKSGNMNTQNEQPDRLPLLQSTIQRLYSRSGNICAFPGCEERFFLTEDAENISNICHIESAKPGGQRFNPSQTNEDRRHYDNLILLCANHHKTTDDIKTYTVEVLKSMKREHEDLIDRRLRAQEEIYTTPSILAEVIHKISNSIDEILDTSSVEHLAPFNIEDKIDYNNILKYKDIFQEYSMFQGSINSVYIELEANGLQKNSKTILTQNVRTQYLKLRNEITNPDELIDAIKAGLIKKDLESLGFNSEIIDISLDIIIVDIFMRCKIFLPPPIIESD